MALVFCDSFDHYSALTDKWTSSRNGGSDLTNGVARFGPGAINSNHRWTQKTLSVTSDVWIAGVAAFWSTQTDNESNNMGVISFLDMNAGLFQVCLQIHPLTGTVIVTRGPTTGIISTTVALPMNVYRYFEMKVKIHNTLGEIEVRLDGAPIITATGLDTQVTGNASANGVRLGTVADRFDGPDFDDFYICDDSGSTNNDFLGDVRIEATNPNGNGNTSNLVGSDANSTDNYLLVDDASPDADTTYVESSTIGDKDTYAYSNITPTSGTVYGVQLNPRARKTDAGTRKFAGVSRLSGTEEDSAEITLSTNYQYFQDIREEKPGGGAWSISDVNSAEFGVKVTT